MLPCQAVSTSGLLVQGLTSSYNCEHEIPIVAKSAGVSVPHQVCAGPEKDSGCEDVEQCPGCCGGSVTSGLRKCLDWKNLRSSVRTSKEREAAGCTG